MENTITFNNANNVTATISPDGILRFNIEANDENALQFIECIERVLDTRITAIKPTLTPEEPCN